MNKKQEELLIEIGFTDNDISIYKTLIPKGSRSINEVIEETNLPRSTVVLSLQKLIDEGVITYHERGKRKNYVVDTPQRLSQFMDRKLSALQEQKLKIVNNIIPQLEKEHFLSGSSGTIKARILRGEKGFKELYTMTLDQKKHSEILRFGGIPEYYVMNRSFMKKYVELRDKHKIKTRLLITDTEMGKAIEEESIVNIHEVRTLPKEKYAPKGNIAIWGDKISLIVWDQDLSAVLIENKNLADMMRMIFEVCWSSSK